MTTGLYDVLIIGGGISGSSLLYELARYTDLKNIALVEKYGDLSQVNSAASNNSQTLHCGDIETNYSLEKAIRVNQAAQMLIHYAKAQKNIKKLMAKYPKMVLGVGPQECALLRKRFEIFSPHFPDMRLWEADDIARIEPALVKDRKEEIVAIGVENQYTAVDYYAMAHSFVENARKEKEKNVDVRLNEEVISIQKKDNIFRIETSRGILKAKFVVVSAGGHSLLFAQSMGYGHEFSCLPVGGSYYFIPEYLKGKVYTVQNDRLPFAAIHGDPDFTAKGMTRIGPTALLLPMLERYNPKTVFDFFKVLKLDLAVIRVMLSLYSVKDIRNYILKNFLFEIPYINRRLFLKDVKKIIPSVKLEDLTFAKGFGGLRPQLIDKKNRELLLGEAKIDTGEGITFNMTPSPGGTVCLDNALKDLKIIVDYLGCSFDEKRFNGELLEQE
ncbi:malate dehydrogenase (quinone) [Desulfobotulus alkaliphilus]|uniref:Malate dehydrogenase (Quinone) n=1 Tax=Desulfobotulus alkaliphilus TaxID=622671 RepID=A0A562S778_9BACT|nr:FAD-dependent oxidoreductase [Desulfobotulus alkaliphilus]TWI77247.1 malate dehydrogenase (quinone) [Desulfobotulus alkaliphilus]